MDKPSCEKAGEKRSCINKLLLRIIENYPAVEAADKIAAVIIAKREHIDGYDGDRAIEEQWIESQCRLLIEMLG